MLLTKLPQGVRAKGSIDKRLLTCYNVAMINSIKQKYFTYQPGEFLPVYIDGKLANRREFHMYRLRWIIKHRHHALYQFTHHAG